MRALPLFISVAARSNPRSVASATSRLPFTARSMASSSSSAEEAIRATIKGNSEVYLDACKPFSQEKFDAYWDRYWAPGSILIRPSGNPLDRDGWSGMMGSEGVEFISSELVSIDTVNILSCGKAAVVTYTNHDVFTYEGTANDDIAKFTVVLSKKDDGSWIQVHAHRSTGQDPE